MSNISVMLSEPSLCLWPKTSELDGILTKKENHQKAKQGLRFSNSRIQSLPCATASFWELIRRDVGITHPFEATCHRVQSHTPEVWPILIYFICNFFLLDYIKIELTGRVQLNKWFKICLCNCSALLTLSEW